MMRGVSWLRRAIMGRLLGGQSLRPGTAQVTASDGTPLTLYDQGVGPAILMLHGGSGNWKAWQFVTRHLAERFCVFAFDRRPYRHVSGAPTHMTMAAEVDDALAVAAHIGRPLLLVGHSSGAVVALEAALAAPGTFAGLFLYEPPVAVDRPLGGEALGRARAALNAGKPGQAMEIFLRDIVQTPGWLAAFTGLVMPLTADTRFRAAGQIVDTENIESLGVGIERYRAIREPVLLLGGATSPPHLGERLQALARDLPNVDSLVVMPRQGHSATLFAAHELAGLIASFADRVLGKTSAGKGG